MRDGLVFSFPFLDLIEFATGVDNERTLVIGPRAVCVIAGTVNVETDGTCEKKRAKTWAYVSGR